jgi:hypothetical protein
MKSDNQLQDQVFHQLQDRVRNQIMGYALNLANDNQVREQGPGWNRLRWKVYDRVHTSIYEQIQIPVKSSLHPYPFYK